MKKAGFLETPIDDIWAQFAPDIDRLEQKRKSSVFFLALVFVLVLVPGLLFAPGQAHIAFVLAALAAFYTFRVLRRKQWLNMKPLSHLIARALLGDAYRPWGIIEAEELAGHGILPAHCRLYREEGYALNVHGYRLRFQEIDAVRSLDPMSVREWREYSVGSGLYVDIELRRDLPAHTILLSRGAHSFLKSFLRQRIGKYQPVGLVSPRFEKRFEVLSTDQVESRVAFHPAFMEKFMEIATHLDARWIEASFKDNKLLIHARYKKDLFQLGYFFRPLMPEDIERLRHELALYSDIIEALRLNPYTAP